jgi:ribonuclease P protein component
LKNYGLSKSERLCKKKEFELVYSTGKTVICRNKKLKATYIAFDDENEGAVKIAVGVFRKSGNAVWRNRIKRLIKESYRLNKHMLIDKAKETRKQVFIVFSLYSFNKKKCNDPKLSMIKNEVLEMIEKIIKAL